MQLIRKVVIAFLVITVFASSNYIFNDNADYQKASAASFYYDKYSLSPGYTTTTSDWNRYYFRYPYEEGYGPYDFYQNTSGFTGYSVDYLGEITLSSWYNASDYDMYKNWIIYEHMGNGKLNVITHEKREYNNGWYGANFYVYTLHISKKGTLLESNVVKDDTYPIEGIKDGFWWVRKGPANQTPSLSLVTPNNQVLS